MQRQRPPFRLHLRLTHLLPMLKHIVMWRFKDGAEGQSATQHAAWMKQQLDALVGVVPEIRSLECGIDVLRTPVSFDAVLTVVVDNIEALSRYANHPAHLKIAERAKLIADTRVAVDYTLD
ncbi:Dabb family protein [Alloprevotella sp. OH1205_COT-284]|uniref:Dabb family protein n=1 Tax=Alloprevotella sp. OH1205_COT-284 TaxID=2491043 RepID=UPI001F1DD063|nr:Dabb family protein [Alloprevotella sp. OH1205_COT-284]